jgi:hypothetical protein
MVRTCSCVVDRAFGSTFLPMLNRQDGRRRCGKKEGRKGKKN